MDVGEEEPIIIIKKIKLDAKVQMRPRTMKDQSPEVILAYFDSVFSIFEFQAINIAPVTQRQPTHQRTNATEINKQSYGLSKYLSGVNGPRISLICVQLFPDRYLYSIPAC